MKRAANCAWYLAVAGAISLAAAACGDDESVLRLKAGEVVRVCTSEISAKNPFGSTNSANRYTVDFEVGPDIRSFVVSTYHPSGSTTLASLTSPSGRYIDLVLDDELSRFHPAGPYTLVGIPIDIDRIMVPPAPRYGDMLENGKWTLQADTTGDKVCVYAAASGPPGDTLDLTVYLIGLDSLDAASAPTSPGWREVMETFADMFEQAGVYVNVDGIRYVDGTLEQNARYALIRNFDDYRALVATSERSRGSDSDLRLNVFLIRGFAGSMRGVLGITSGIPGAAGVHGTRDSGVVVGVEELLGVDDVGGGESGGRALGFTLAHEVGHFLGLFHTTEGFGGVDPIPDTPTCPRLGVYHPGVDLREACDDAENLMFPYALGNQLGLLTPGQAEALHLNPLIQPRTGDR